MTHIPCLQKEVLDYFKPCPNDNFIDATCGEGGHTISLLKKNGPMGKVLALELDTELYRELKKELKKRLGEIQKRLLLINDSYVNLKEIVEKYGFKQVKGILFDLGMSSWHLEKSKRGFSFKRKEPLDMRYDTNQDLKAEEIVNRFPQEEIERILREYGGERFSRRIARQIVEARKENPIKNTFQLVEIIKKAYPRSYQKRKIHTRKIHPATRTFQALRIAVNRELDNLEKVLPQTIEILEEKGKLAVISFHSGEDRLVKNFLKDSEKKGLLKILTKKPIFPSLKEIEKNPRARSARLRVAQKIRALKK